MAPNVAGVGAPGRRTVYGLCGICAVRCPIEVTVEDGRGEPAHLASLDDMAIELATQGLAAAYYLRTFGHRVEVFEAQEKAGGMLRYGIPAYCMPPDLLEQELDQIRVLGVQIHTNAKVDSLESCRKDCDAVFIGPGTQRTRLIPIEGVHQPCVLGGIAFLRAVRGGTLMPVNVFGQFEISDGNPNPLKWMAFGGIGGAGLIPRRSQDNWGIGYYCAAPSKYLQDLPEPYPGILHEQAWEVFYNFALTPWLVLGADVQIVRPSMASDTAVFSGLRLMIGF